MAGFKLNMGLDPKSNIRLLLEDIDLRITQYLRGFVRKLSEDYEKQIIGRYGSSKEDSALDVIDNIRVAYLNKSQVPSKTKGKTRPEKKLREMHHAGVFVASRKRSSDEIDKATTVLKVIPNKRGFKQSPPEVFVLVKYGPWHLDELPFLPNDRDATLLYTEVGNADTTRVKTKNKQQKPKVNAMLKKYNVKITPRSKILEDVKAFENTEYWVLRKEFGLDGRKLAAWRPGLQYVAKKGYMKLITQDRDLHRTLSDPNYKGYKSIDSGIDKVSEDDANSLEKFQDKIR